MLLNQVHSREADIVKPPDEGADEVRARFRGQQRLPCLRSTA